jgi:predicted RNase H-like HicB family nuclease
MSGLFNRLIQFWRSSDGNSQAAHMREGDNHAIVFNSLRVLIVQDEEGYWFAQSRDIDYAAGGDTLEDVQRNFETGLSQTIKVHLEHFGNIDRIMRTPKPEDWQFNQHCNKYGLTMVAQHQIEDQFDGLPYANIAFYQPRTAA